MREIFNVFKETEDFLESTKPNTFIKNFQKKLPLYLQELLSHYPDLSPEEREEAFGKEKKKQSLFKN